MSSFDKHEEKNFRNNHEIINLPKPVTAAGKKVTYFKSGQ